MSTGDERTVWYRIRAATPDDFDAVAEVVVADELADAGQVVLGGDFVRAEWSRDGFDLATDAWVIIDDTDGIVGYAQATRAGPDEVWSWGVVHPDERGRGLGSMLVDRVEDRAAELLEGRTSGRFRHAINAHDQAAAALLRERGLRPIHHFWHMQIEVDGAFDPGPAPDGIEIADVDPSRDLPAIHGILAEAFLDDLSHQVAPYDRWVEEETGDGFDASLWLLSRDGTTPTGTLTASAAQDRGWIDYLGVVGSHRGRGVASALLRRSFARFAERGLGRVLVSVDAENPTGATGVYERAGMRLVKGWELWERPTAR